MSVPMSTAPETKEPSARQKALETMLLQERRFYERKCKEYVQNPSVRIKDTLGESERRMQQLEEQLTKLNGASTSTAPASNAREGGDAMDGTKIRRNRTSFSNSSFGDHPNGKSNERRQSSRTVPDGHSSEPRLPEQVKLAPNVKDKLANICIDDEDYDEAVAEDNATGPFASLDNLSMKPAHMAVFMQYLVNDGSAASDPAPLFFFLLTGIFQRQSQTGRELRRMARDVAQTFLAGPGKAPLQVDVKPSIVEKIQEALEDRNSSDDKIRTLFVTARFELAKRVTVQLSAFREMRAIGLSTMFGEFQLQDNMTRAMELEIVQKVLGPTLNELSGADSSGNPKAESAVSARNAALAMSILTIMEDVGITSSSMKQKKVDRMSSFQTGGKGSRSLFSRNKSKRQVHMIASHQFVAKHYNSLTFCDHCHGLLWGLGNQGYNCQVCGFNVHKTSCNTELTVQCPGVAVEHTSAPLIGHRPSQPSVSPSPSSTLTSTGSVKSQASSQATLTELADIQKQEHVTAKVKEFESRVQGTDTGDLRRGGSLRPRGSQLSLSAGAHDYQDERRPCGASVQRAQSLKLGNERPLRYMQQRGGSEDARSDKSSLSPVSLRSSSVNDLTRVVSDADVSSVTSTDFEDQQQSALTDPDLDVDEELQPWSSKADKKFVKLLSKKEVKRQDLIHELIHTERTHIRKLKVMLYLFYRPLLNAQLLPSKEMVRSLFPHLEELIALHCDLLARLRERIDSHSHSTVSYISEAIAAVFDGDQGTALKNAAAEWVKLRQENLESLKQWRTKHPRFSQFIQMCEAQPICNRLQLTDLTSIVMTRLTKYPLLLEGILRVTTSEVSDRDMKDLPKTIELCRKALTHVNQVVKEYENMKLLQSIQARLDTKDLERAPHPSIAAYRQLDLGLKVLIHNGDLVWRMRRQALNVHGIVVSDLLLLLEHNEDKTRYYLRMRDDISPVLRLSETLPPREVATDKKAFFLVNISDHHGPKMYELAAPSLTDRKTWFTMMETAIQDSKVGTGSIFPTSTSSQSNMLVSQRSRPLPPRPSDNGKEADSDLSGDEDAISEGTQPRTRTSDFGSQLQTADQRISDALEEKSLLVAEYEGYWLDENSGRTARSEADVHNVLRRCIQQADAVVGLANDLLQPSDCSADSGSIMRPSNYQLVDASSKLRNQLSALTGLIERRDKMIANMRSEIALLQDRAQQLGVSVPADGVTVNDLTRHATPSPADEVSFKEHPTLQISIVGEDSGSSSPGEPSSRPGSSDHVEPPSPRSGQDSASIDDDTSGGLLSYQHSADSKEEEEEEEENIAGEED